MAKHAQELRYAIRFRVVLKYVGQLCLVLAALTLVPLGVSLGSGDTAIGLRYAVVVGALSILGATLARLRATSRIQPNEALVVTALIFLLGPLCMSYPMMGSGLPFPDALFEAISGATTTGLSTAATIVDKPTAFLFARAWMQWYGGLGIVVLSLALVVQPGLAAKRLAVTEDPGSDLVGGTKAHARRVLAVYCALTAAGVVCVWSLGADLFEAVVYTFSAVSTGGFAPHDRSLTGLGEWPAQWTVTGLCLAGSVPLALYHRAYRKGLRTVLEERQLWSLVAACALGTALLAACMRWVHAATWGQTLYHAPLLALSAQTTAGFSTVDPGGLDAASKTVLIVGMAIGGGAGSTAGGFKIVRLMILLQMLHVAVVRTCLPPHALLDPRLGNRRLEDPEIQEALTIILLFLMVVAISWILFVAAGYDPLDSLFEVVSATGTVGLSAGVTGSDLPVHLKGVLCLDMLMGRLEMMAWLVVLFPGTWLGRRAEAS